MIETAPRVVKLYANRANLGFSDAGDIEPTQRIEFAEDNELTPPTGKDVELRFVKFQRVKGLTVRIQRCYVTPHSMCFCWLLIRMALLTYL